MNTVTSLDPHLLSILQSLKEYLQSLYGENLHAVILFGSRARGDAREDSDVDVLVVLNEPFKYYQEVCRISEFLSELCLENNLLICCHFTTAERWKNENSGFYRNVRREGIIL